MAPPLDLPVRRRLRRQHFDYAAACPYFVTVCTAARAPCLARIMASRVCLTGEGRCVTEAWRWVLGQYPAVGLLDGVIMPDHFHVLVALDADATWSLTLSHVMWAVKARSTRLIHTRDGTSPTRVWQRSFHDHVVRTPGAVAAIRKYIRENPHQWWLTHGDTPEPHRLAITGP